MGEGAWRWRQNRGSYRVILVEGQQVTDNSEGAQIQCSAKSRSKKVTTLVSPKMFFK